MDIREIGKIFSNFSLNKLAELFFSIKIKTVVFLMLISISTYSVFIWYNYIYNPEWEDGKKQDYIEDEEMAVAFNKKNFKIILEEYDLRKIELQNKINVEDIFRLEK